MVFIDPEDSPSTTAIALLKAALARGLRTIVYCRSRRMTELIALWAADKAGSFAGRISAYLGGLFARGTARDRSPHERRAIACRGYDQRAGTGDRYRQPRRVHPCGVSGHGHFDHATGRSGGAGRAGIRGAARSRARTRWISIFIHQPEAFFRGASRNGRSSIPTTTSSSSGISNARRRNCRASDDPWLAWAGAQAALRELEREGLLLKSADGREWVAARKRPQRHVDLRGCGASCTIVDAEGKPIGSVDGHQAYKETHPGAVYLHRGKTYVVKSLDMAERVVRCEVPQQRVNWHTRVRSHKETAIIEVKASGSAFGAPVAFGRLRVTETITGYEQRSVADNRLICVVPLDLPPLVFETEGLWFLRAGWPAPVYRGQPHAFHGLHPRAGTCEYRAHAADGHGGP